MPRFPLAPSTLSALCALGTLLAGVKAPEPAAPVFPLPCRVSAYLFEPAGLTIRTGPGQQYELIKQLPRKQPAPLLMIRAGLGNWMKITDVQSNEGQLLFPGPGWVWGPQLATLTRGSQDDQQSPLYREPDTRSKIEARLKAATPVRILGCHGAWLKVRAGRSEGWLAADEQCARPGGCQ